MYIFDLISRFILVFILSYYLINNLQWFNYSFFRILTKHTKKRWHLVHFVIPVIVFFLTSFNLYIFYIYLYIIEIPLILYWYLKLDKRLIFTKRIVRLFIIIALFMILNEVLVFTTDVDVFRFTYLLPLLFGFVVSFMYENILFINYVDLSKSKLYAMKDLKIIGITGSYGKTSIKNFLFEILKQKFNVYATPRSVNTYKGIIYDINKNLDSNHEIYIVEMGARNIGDINQIAKLVNHDYAIISKIGNAHIQYFKDINNILKTKFEILHSFNLKKVFLNSLNKIPEVNNKFKVNLNKIYLYPSEIKNIVTTLDFSSFEFKVNNKWESFKTNLLGKFNIENICVCISIALELGIKIEIILDTVKKLEPIPHRLQKIVANNKIIIDDSFNGNLEGMSEAIRISSLHTQRKVIVTPGIVESDEESNIMLAKKINEVFDLAIITGELNSKLLSREIKIKKIILKDKTQLESTLKIFTKEMDLILFANDAPNYV